MPVVDEQTGSLVSVVIVNYNGAGVLDECLISLRSQRYRPIEIIVIDNGSTDNSVEMVRSKYPEARLDTHPENLGFAGGCNRGLEIARGEFIALLNNDTVVEENWLGPLVTLARRPGVGVVCSKVITEGVPPEFYEMNGTVNYLGYNFMRVFQDLSQVFYASGASLLVRRDHVDHLFPDEYFIYHEDVYLSWKMRLLGLSIAMAQDSVVHHRGSATTKLQASTAVAFYQERNRILNCLLFYELRTLFLLLPYFLADAIAKVFVGAISNRKSLVGVVRAYWWLFTNTGWIRAQRSQHQRLRQVRDSSIMRLMSSDVVDSGAGFARLANRLSKAYADSVGLAHHG
jgi:GT2 family glycosyltransferase